MAQIVDKHKKWWEINLNWPWWNKKKQLRECNSKH